MKTKFITLFLVIAPCFNFMKAQEITCSDFCVESIGLDTNNTYPFSVTLFFNGTNSDFINYPYFSVVTNLFGDTIANGTMDFFGQIGNTSQTYSLMSNLASLPENFECSLTFNYDDTVACLLNFPCPISSLDDQLNKDVKLQVYPNPSNEIIYLKTSENFHYIREVELSDAMGKRIDITKIVTSLDSVSIDVSKLPKGVYFLDLKNGQKLIKILVQ